jgi:cytochrome d ubiquinol oxidase subunit I
MDIVTLSRLQFAMTTLYHFLFVPLTLGLGWVVAIMQTIYFRNGDENWKRMTKFWGKLFLINFAMGVATGIVQEFQFGMNWSEYSRYVGDIFGAPLAIEALAAFFMESTFLGVWLFGWDRIDKRLHLLAIWLVVFASDLSALWILIANAFMQHPVGYAINPDTGYLQLVDFFALVGNPKAWVMFLHTFFAGFAMGAFFVMGISVYHLMRKTNIEIFKPSFQLAVVIGLLTSTMVILSGHQQGIEVLQSQPMKMASIEALWETENPASFSLLTIGDLSGKREVWSIRVPALLSVIAYNQFTGQVRGVNDIQREYVIKYGPGDYVPLMVFTYWGFRVMFFAALAMFALSLYGLYAIYRDRVEHMRFAKLFLYAIPLPFIATTGGWIVTEMGRQPWIVQGLMKTEQGVSPNLTPEMVLFSLVGFFVIYVALIVADIYLIANFAKQGPDATDKGFIGDATLLGEQYVGGSHA